MSKTPQERLLDFQNAVLIYIDSAYNYAYWLSKNSHDAEDISQEACTRAFAAFDRFEPTNAKAWLLTIVRHTFLSNLRKNKRDGDVLYLDGQSQAEITPPALQELETPEINLLRFNNQELVRQSIDALNAEHREIIILRELEDLSYNEIANMLDCAVGTVMSRLSRARSQLNIILTRTFNSMEKKA